MSVPCETKTCSLCRKHLLSSLLVLPGARISSVTARPQSPHAGTRIRRYLRESLHRERNEHGKGVHVEEPNSRSVTKSPGSPRSLAPAGRARRTRASCRPRAGPYLWLLAGRVSLCPQRFTTLLNWVWVSASFVRALIKALVMLVYLPQIQSSSLGLSLA